MPFRRRGQGNERAGAGGTLGTLMPLRITAAGTVRASDSEPGGKLAPGWGVGLGDNDCPGEVAV